jgi:hypothetical protein
MKKHQFLPGSCIRLLTKRTVTYSSTLNNRDINMEKGSNMQPNVLKQHKWSKTCVTKRKDLQSRLIFVTGHASTLHCIVLCFWCTNLELIRFAPPLPDFVKTLTTRSFLQIILFCFYFDITPCNPLKVNGRFGGIFRLHLQNKRIIQTGNEHELYSKQSILRPRRLTVGRNITLTLTSSRGFVSQTSFKAVQ